MAEEPQCPIIIRHFNPEVAIRNKHLTNVASSVTHSPSYAQQIINVHHAGRGSALTNNCKQVSPWGLSHIPVMVITVIILSMII